MFSPSNPSLGTPNPRPGLPFGKYRGQPLAAVPADYLAWLLRSCELRPGLRANVEAELQARAVGAEGADDGETADLDVTDLEPLNRLSTALCRVYLRLTRHQTTPLTPEALAALLEAAGRAADELCRLLDGE
jgi:hypothetical protein